MRIDLDQIWDTVAPQRLTLVIGGREHAVRRFTIADARRAAEFGQHSVEDEQAWLSGVFEGDPPGPVTLMTAELDEDRRAANNLQVLTIVDALVAWCLREHDQQKKSDAIHRAIAEKIHSSSSG